MAIDRDKVLEAAQGLVEKKRYDKAIVEYQKVLAADPKDARTWLKIGEAYLKAEQFETAIATFEQVAQLHAAQGFALKAVAAYVQAREVVQRYVPHLTERFGYLVFRIADLYVQVHRNNDAIQIYEETAARLDAAGRHRDAIDILKKIVELDPKNVDRAYRLAEGLIRIGEGDAAVPHLGAAAEGLVARGQHDDAIGLLERALALRADPNLARQAAQLYLDRGGPKDAGAAFLKIQISYKAAPKDLDTLGLLARTLYVLRQPERAIEVHKEAARVARENAKSDVFDQHMEILVARAPNDPVVRKLAVTWPKAPAWVHDPAGAPPAPRLPQAPPRAPIMPPMPDAHAPPQAFAPQVHAPSAPQVHAPPTPPMHAPPHAFAPPTPPMHAPSAPPMHAPSAPPMHAPSAPPMHAPPASPIHGSTIPMPHAHGSPPVHAPPMQGSPIAPPHGMTLPMPQAHGQAPRMPPPLPSRAAPPPPPLARQNTPLPGPTPGGSSSGEKTPPPRMAPLIPRMTAQRSTPPTPQRLTPPMPQRMTPPMPPAPQHAPIAFETDDTFGGRVAPATMWEPPSPVAPSVPFEQQRHDDLQRITPTPYVAPTPLHAPTPYVPHANIVAQPPQIPFVAPEIPSQELPDLPDLESPSGSWEGPKSFAGRGGFDEEALEEVDFFVTQGMFEDAIGLLDEQLARLPGHPLLLDRRREIEEMAQAAAAGEA